MISNNKKAALSGVALVATIAAGVYLTQPSAPPTTPAVTITPQLPQPPPAAKPATLPPHPAAPISQPAKPPALPPRPPTITIGEIAVGTATPTTPQHITPRMNSSTVTVSQPGIVGINISAL